MKTEIRKKERKRRFNGSLELRTVCGRDTEREREKERQRQTDRQAEREDLHELL